MKKLSAIKESQKSFIDDIIHKTDLFISSIPKDDLEVILLSGSVSRGDYFPGHLGGMIDLTIMRNINSKITAEKLFGVDEDPGVPYHCIQWQSHWFSIAFHDFIDADRFQLLEEPKKFSLLESTILWEHEEKYSEELFKIKASVKHEHDEEKQRGLDYINYLLSDYKVNRWEMRGAYPQLHANLNSALQTASKCLYYINGKYSPAEDRLLYYSYDLDILPDNYEELVTELMRQNINSAEDYRRRERLFKYEFCAVFQ